MARNLQWQLCIDSDAGNQYTAKIYTSATVSSVVTLTAAATPIITADDSGDDLFKAIRHSSGYLRFIGGSSLAASIMPDGMTDRFVEICEGSTVVWCGYLSPQAFESPWDSVQEYELLMHGALRVLDSIDWPAANTGTYSFAAVIREAMYAIFGDYTYVTHYYFPHHLGLPASFLGLTLQGLNFIGSEDNDNGTTTLVASSTYADVLTAICQLFGLQMRLVGTKLYFTDYPVSQYQDPTNIDTLYAVTADQLNAYVTAGTTISATTATVTTHTLANLSFRGTDNSMGSILGKRRCTFAANIGEMTNIISLPTDKISHLCKGATVNTYDDSEDPAVRHYYRGNMLGSSLVTKTLSDASSILTLRSHYESTSYYCCPAVQTDSVEVDEASDKKTYSWGNAIHLHILNTNSSLSLRSRGSVVLSNGMLVINAKISSCWLSSLTLIVRVGNKYWTGSAWSTTVISFSVNTTASDGSNAELATPSAFSLSSNYQDIKGYPISIEGVSITGDVEVKIIGRAASSSMPTSYPYINILSALTASFQRIQSDASFVSESPNNYSPASTPARQFTGDLSITTPIGSDRKNAFGRGHLFLGSSGAYFSTFSFQRSGTGGSSGYAHPEQEVIDGAAQHYENRHRTVRATISVASTLPTCAELLTDQSSYLYTIASVSRDYIRDEATIYAVEL